MQTVDHALGVLEEFGPESPELGVADLSRRLGIPAPSAYRLLSSLESRGFVEQNPSSRRYRLGLKFFEIASRVTAGLDVVGIAHSFLEELVRLTQETAYVAVWDRSSSVVVDRIDSPLPVSVRKTVGMRLPPNGSSTGKCLFAFQSRETIERVLAAGLVPCGERSVTDPDVLRVELEQIRQRGFASNRGEFRKEAGGVAAPIRDRFGHVVAAVGLGIPMPRMGEQRMSELIAAVLTTAAAISTRLGWNQSVPPLAANATKTVPAPPTRKEPVVPGLPPRDGPVLGKVSPGEEQPYAVKRPVTKPLQQTY